MEFVHTLLMLVTWPLLGVDVINSANGLGPACFVIAFFPFFAGFVLSSLKVVHLGDRVLPRAVRKHLAVPEQSSESERKLGSVKADLILSVSLFIMVTALMLAIPFTVIIGPLSKGTTDLWTRLGAAMEGILCSCGTLIILRQTFRVVRYIEVVHTTQMKVVGSVSGISKTALQHTLLKMKFRALAVILGVSCSNIFFFLCAGGLFTPWYFMLMTLVASLIGTTGTTIMYMPRTMSVCCCFSPQLADQSGHTSPTASAKVNQQATRQPRDLDATRMDAGTLTTSPETMTKKENSVVVPASEHQDPPPEEA